MPLDKEKNADGRRCTLEPLVTQLEPRPPSGIAPHLQQLMADYAATGLPPAFLPHHGQASASASCGVEPNPTNPDEENP
jgi:putative transposase